MRVSTPIRATIALGAVLVLASCSGGGTPAPTESSTAVEDRTATVVIGGQITPSHLDPHRGVTENDIGMLRYWYDPLTTVVGNGEAAPFLAESWELSEDGSTFTMKLREDVTFVDGEPFNAAAVVANFNRMISDPNSTVAYILEPIIASSEAVDEFTVKLNLKGGGGALPTILASRAGMMVSPKALENPDVLITKPIGAGAFELVDVTPGASYASVRRDDYWDKDAYKFAKLDYLVQADTATRLNSLAAGETTLTAVIGPQKQEAEAAGLKTWESEEPGTAFYRFSMNSDRAAFGDKRVRQAMSAAVDREAISAALFQGQCVPSAQPFPEGYFARSTTLDDSKWKNFDLDYAKKLMAEAGYADGFTFTAAVPTLGTYQNFAQILQAQFAEIGITMNLEVIDTTQARQAFVTGKSDALVGFYGGGTDPGIYAMSAYSPKSGDNPGGLTTDNMAALLAETQRSTDIDERHVAFEALMDEAFEMGPAQIVVCHPVGVNATQQNISNFEQTGPLGSSYALRVMTVSK
ncbi:MAG: ABC transporter substrate-binding protein [Microbacteriaceae bacterium]|jgi:peptide/nickel transport system substrate-binding protein